MARIFAKGLSDGTEAAQRFLVLAHDQGYDIRGIYAILDDAGQVREAALGIPGPGRTAMLYVSAPPLGKPDGATASQDRAACIDAVCAHLHGLRESGVARVCIAQTLLDPSDSTPILAFESAAFRKVGRLRYLHQPIGRPARAPIRWPPGVAVESVGRLAEGSNSRRSLLRAMEHSYAGTLDCPSLCGLRATEDVLASHLATGAWDPALWWIVRDAGEPHGCMLLSRCPEQDTVELVYLGLSPQARGRGIASMLMQLARATLNVSDGATWSCAVDEANAPALKLYEKHGFVPYARRDALVRPLHRPAE